VIGERIKRGIVCRILYYIRETSSEFSDVCVQCSYLNPLQHSAQLKYSNKCFYVASPAFCSDGVFLD